MSQKKSQDCLLTRPLKLLWFNFVFCNGVWNIHGCQRTTSGRESALSPLIWVLGFEFRPSGTISSYQSPSNALFGKEHSKEMLST